MVEALIILPLAIVILLCLLQLIWLFWAQQTLHMTGHYVLRTGTLQHGQLQSMQNTLATGMASTRVVSSAKDSAALNEQERQQMAWQSTMAALAHAKLASHIAILSPTAEQLKSYSERRFDQRTQTFVDEIAIDQPQLRVKLQRDPEAWQAALQLEIEIWWCLPLQIPLAAAVLQQWRNLANPEQGFCAMREALLGKPLWPLVTKRKGPMQSGFRTN